MAHIRVGPQQPGRGGVGPRGGRGAPRGGLESGRGACEFAIQLRSHSQVRNVTMQDFHHTFFVVKNDGTVKYRSE